MKSVREQRLEIESRIRTANQELESLRYGCARENVTVVSEDSFWEYLRCEDCGDRGRRLPK